MASGDLAASTPVYCDSETSIDTAVTALNLAAVTDRLCIIPWRDGCLVFKVERTA